MTEKIRIDKWLWQARFYKTRSLAARQVAAGHVRLGEGKVSKPATLVGPGDVVSFPQGHVMRVVEVAQAGMRRGPASEAQTLYRDLTPAQERRPFAPRFEGGGRPTKRDRRNLDAARDRMRE